MGIGLLGQKLGMSQLYTEQGEVIPVTVIQAGPCCVLQVKTLERDGYEAVQLGFKDKPRRLARRSERGHVANIDSKRQKARSRPARQLRRRLNANRNVLFANSAAALKALKLVKTSTLNFSTTFLRSTLRRPARARYFWRYEAS